MLATATLDQFVEYRCNRCWHSNCAATHTCGQRTTCANCGEHQIVPEATPERISRAAQMLSTSAIPPGVAKRGRACEEMTEAQLLSSVREDGRLLDGQMNFANHPLASHFSRLAAYIVDIAAFALAAFLGVAAVGAAMNAGWISPELNEENPFANVEQLCLFSFPILAFLMVQWNLIATRGQTVGKMLLGIRIINRNGGAPGFVQGVVLRNWMRVALALIPFFSVVDIFFIFGESRRCLHDYLAGTSVMQA